VDCVNKYKNEYKQVIVVRCDLNISKGKLATQVAHAAVTASEEAKSHNLIWWRKWWESGQKKVVLKVENEEELLKIYKECLKSGLPVALIRDAGLTEIPPGTLTAVGIGPAPSKSIDKITGSLPLLK